MSIVYTKPKTRVDVSLRIRYYVMSHLLSLINKQGFRVAFDCRIIDFYPCNLLAITGKWIHGRSQ